LITIKKAGITCSRNIDPKPSLASFGFHKVKSTAMTTIAAG
jgi:hypothetical protein